MRRIDLFQLLTLICWIYQISTDSTFSVQTIINTPSHDWHREFQIDCAICGFSDTDYINFEVEWHLQKNLSITSPAKTTPGHLEGNNTKYTWQFFPITSGNSTVIRLIDKDPTPFSFGIYTCYVTLNKNITKHSSVDLSSGEESISSNYVLIRITDVPGVEIAKSCRKYGYDVLLDESVAKTVLLRENERVYFPVCPSIQINNRSIAVCKPWISKKGCYNLTIDTIDNSVEMDCRNISIENWNKSLPLIGNTTRGSCYLLDGDVKGSNLEVSDAYCSETASHQDNRTVFLNLFSILEISPKSVKETKSECMATYMDVESSELYEMPCNQRCDAYCSEYDGSDLSFHGYLHWEDARKECHSLNKSLPRLSDKFVLSNPIQLKNTTFVCLDVFKSPFVLFQNVIKRATRVNGTIIINASSGYTEKLPYLCGSKIESNSRDCNMTICDFDGPGTLCTSTETLESNTEMQPKPDTSENLLLPIIIISAIVGLLLVIMIVACLITRVSRRKEKQGYKSSTTEEILTNLYSEPTPGPGESKMKMEDRVTAEGEYSVADTKDDKYSQPKNRDNKRAGPVYSFALNPDVEYSEAVTTTDSEYAETDLGEYDVLRGKRQKCRESASSHRDIYDRTNNVVTGIYDVTSNTQNENEYSIMDKDVKQ